AQLRAAHGDGRAARRRPVRPRRRGDRGEHGSGVNRHDDQADESGPVSDARVTKITTSLARQVFEPGGRSISNALQKANAELEVHREPVMTAITATLDELDAVAAKATPE